MIRELSNPEQYSVLWTKESEFLESHGIYEKLSHHTPKGNTLELGCGTGKGTRYLSKGRSVLSLDSNQYLIDAANSYLEDVGVNRNIHNCDFFELTLMTKKL